MKDASWPGSYSLKKERKKKRWDILTFNTYNPIIIRPQLQYIYIYIYLYIYRDNCTTKLWSWLNLRITPCATKS
jgi:hypothetical protein